MIYHSRPVLEVKPNWLSSPVEEFAFDLRGIRRGFGSSTFAPTALHVARGWSMDFTFGTAQEFADFSAFIAARSGRLDGFWFPNLALQFVLVAGISSTQFDIETQNLAGTWTDDVCDVLYAIRPDGTTIAVGITGVAVPSAGLERIDVESLGSTPTPSWRFYRMLYVRLADDMENVVAHCEGVYTQSVKVVELPEEYAAVETGQTPAYLYDFWQDNGDATLYHWRYTSFATAITSSGDVFAPCNLTHGAVKQSTRADRTEIRIETVWDSAAPWAKQLPFPGTRPLNLTVWEVDVTDPDVRTVYFSGELSDSNFDGTDVSLSFDHWFDAMRRQLPGRTIQPRCHYQLFDPLTCKADPTSYSTPYFQLTISATTIAGFTATVTHAQFTAAPSDYPTDFFAGGKLRVGVAPLIEERMIVASTAPSGGEVELTLSQRILHQTTPVAGLLQRGCDRFYSTCKNLFGNQVNFPAFVDVPRVNPTFKAIEIATGTAGKK